MTESSDDDPRPGSGPPSLRPLSRASRASRPPSRSSAPRVDPDVSEASDRELVAGLRAASESAFDHVYERYRVPLFAFLVRLSGKRWLAEELLQETWLRLARNASALPADTELRAWLFTVARNLFLSHRRWAVLDADRLRELGLWPKASLERETPFEQASANQTQARLERVLAGLPFDYREVILLVAVEGLEPSAAAKVLGMRADAVRQRLARARAMLNERLAKDERKTR